MAGGGIAVSRRRLRRNACWMCAYYNSTGEQRSCIPTTEDIGYCPNSSMPRNAYESTCDVGKMDRVRVAEAVAWLVANGRDPEAVYLKPGEKTAAESMLPLSDERLAEAKALCLKHRNMETGKVLYKGTELTRRDLDELIKIHFLRAKRLPDGNSDYIIVKGEVPTHSE